MPIIEQGERKPLPDIKKEKVPTVDDLLIYAGKLYKGLISLSNQKNPLEIRRGVNGMYEQKGSEIIKAIGRTYFLDIEKTQAGKPYLKLTESRKDAKNGEQVRNTIYVYQEDIKPFAEAIARISLQIGLSENDK